MTGSNSNPGGGKLRCEYEIRDDETAVLAVVCALSAATGSTATEIPPLYDSIDPDSLNRLCTSLSGEYRVEFTHHGFHITLVDGETIELRAVDEE